MVRFKKILCMNDRKEGMHPALERAVEMARREGASLTLAEARDDIPAGPEYGLSASDVEELGQLILRDSEKRLRNIIDPIKASGIDVTAKVMVGTQFMEIIREVTREGHDLLILSPQRKAALREMLFGSRIMHLMRKCPCPVWAVIPSRGSRHARIMAAVDPVPSDEVRDSLNRRIMETAISLARAEGSEIHVIHCWASHMERAMRARGVLLPSEVRRIVADVRKTHKKALDALVARFDFGGLPHHVHMLKGDADTLIVEQARKKRIELVVMGTVCRTGLKGFFMGNTAEKVLHRIGCSVLALKPEGFVSPVALE